jgi:hypothetical protein
MVSIPHAWLSPSGQNWTCYMYGTRVYWGVQEGNVYFLRNMRGNDKEYLDSKEEYQGIGDVSL